MSCFTRVAARYETVVFVDESLRGKTAFLYFGAVYHNAKAYLNGRFVGEHSRSGHTPFQTNVTDMIHFGTDIPGIGEHT